MRPPASLRLPGFRVLFLALLALPAPVRGQCDVTATAGSVVVPSPPVPAVATNASPFGTFQATADYGALGVSASVDLPENTSDSGMNSIAEFDDRLTITAPGVAQFTAGTFTAVIDTGGTPDVVQAATGSGVAQGMTANYQLFLSVNGGTVHLLAGLRSYNSGQVPPDVTTGQVPAPGIEEVDIPFLFGIEFSLSAFLLASVGGSNINPQGASGTIAGNCQVTFDWSGISSIRDSQGTEYLGAAAVTSCSGFDWKGNSAPTDVTDLVPSAPVSRLEASFPNPFRVRATIPFSVAAAGPVSIELFDVGGRRVDTLHSAFRSAGRHTVTWDGVDGAGRQVPSGVYFVRLLAGDRIDQERIVLRK